MKKKISVILIAMVILCFLGGCSTPELSYSGSEILYTCTDDEINLFNEDVDVIITDKQGFCCFDGNSEMREFTDGVLEINDENRLEVEKCYFVSYEEFTDNEFSGRSNIAFRDPEEGSMKLRLKGSYSYKVRDSKRFIENYTDIETLHNKIITEITAVYIVNMGSKTFAALSAEKEFDSAKLEALNMTMIYKYGIEVTQVNTVPENVN